MLDQPQRGEWVWGWAARPDRGRRSACCLGGAGALSGPRCCHQPSLKAIYRHAHATFLPVLSFKLGSVSGGTRGYVYDYRFCQLSLAHKRGHSLSRTASRLLVICDSTPPKG